MLPNLSILNYAVCTFFIASFQNVKAEEMPNKQLEKSDPFLADLLQNLDYLKNNTNLEPQSVDSRMFEPPSSLVLGNVAEAKRYARLAGAAYCSDNTLQKWNCIHCQKVKVQHIKTFFDEETEARVYLAKDASKKEIIVSFRGSSTLKNFIQDAKFKKELLTLGKNKLWVHKGFKQCTDALIPLYLPTLKKLISENRNYKVVVTGHSLGGSVSTLSALVLRNKLKIKDSNLKVYTYGEPRVGDIDFARYVNRQAFTLTRFVNNNDLVPHLPPQVKWITDYQHHQHEIWINNNKEKICGNEYLEDPECSASKWTTPSVDDHLMAWDIKLGGTC